MGTEPFVRLSLASSLLTLAAAFIYRPETEEVEQSTALLAQVQDFRRNKVFSYLAYQQLKQLPGAMNCDLFPFDPGPSMRKYLLTCSLTGRNFQSGLTKQD